VAKIQASMVPQQVPLSADPSGETWVVVKPPGWAEEKRRGGMLANRTDYFDESGMPATRVDVNIRELADVEIWLTYVETNLEVELLDEDGKVEETITFKPKAEEDPAGFVRKLSKLPSYIVYSWRAAVVDVVPDWRHPF